MDDRVLQETERKLTEKRRDELMRMPVEDKFDFKYLKFIHKYLFQDIYKWGGELRREAVFKGSTEFCEPEEIAAQGKLIFRNLKKDKFLRGLPRGKFADKLAVYMSDANNLHAFREGNGRANRKFFALLAIKAGYEIHFSDVSKSALLDADRAASYGRYAPLRNILFSILN